MSEPVTFAKKVAASDMKLAATWRKRWDSNPRALADYRISSFIAVCYLHGFSCQFQPALYARKPA